MGILRELMAREECTREEAIAIIKDAISAVKDGESLEDVCLEHLGLEIDYCVELSYLVEKSKTIKK